MGDNHMVDKNHKNPVLLSYAYDVTQVKEIRKYTGYFATAI